MGPLEGRGPVSDRVRNHRVRHLLAVIQRAMGPWNAIEPRIIWTLVITISGIGFVNYLLVKRYEGRGIAVTGFFGVLVNSIVVIAEMAKRAATDPSL